MQRDEGPVQAASQPAYQTIADRLRRQILEQDLRPGDRLPVEADLARHFGVGRSTVREALRTLTTQNFTVTLRGVGGGTFVRSPEPGDLAASITTSLDFLTSADGITVAELLEARELLEVPAARLAAARRTEDHLRIIERVLEDPGTPSLYEANREFHAGVLAASGNRLLEIMTRPVFSILRERMLRDAAPDGFHAAVLDHHRRIASAIVAGDPETAGSSMTDHLRQLRSAYELMDRKGRPL